MYNTKKTFSTNEKLKQPPRGVPRKRYSENMH